MTAQEFNDNFDVLYNNITSNQAPGLDSYEKSVFLTKAQDELVKNYFLKQSNPKQAGFDDNQKRQADFSNLMKTLKTGNNAGDLVLDHNCKYVSQPTANTAHISLGSMRSANNSTTNLSPTDVFIIINERIKVSRSGSDVNLVVKPISYEEYDRLMQKPFKYPVHYQAWRLMVNSDKEIDLVAGPTDTISDYVVRYIKRPKPIIIDNLGGLTIDGYEYGTGTNQTQGCELDPILHQEILQRAVELAKVAWTANGQDNAQLVIQAGARSE